MAEKDIINLVLEMARREKEHAEKLRNTSSMFRHPIIQVLIEGISLDSEKHSLLFNTISRLLEEDILGPLASELLTLPDTEIEMIKNTLREHIRTETKMIETVKKLMDLIDNKDIRTVLSYIYEDEIRHHNLLVEIDRRVAERYREHRKE